RRADGRTDAESLRDRGREVVPPGGQQRRVGGADELEDTLARERAEEAGTAVEAELARPLLERDPLVAVADDEERHTVDACESLERRRQALLRAEPPCEQERVSFEAVLAPQQLALRQLRSGRRRVGDHGQARRREAPRERDPPQGGAGA